MFNINYNMRFSGIKAYGTSNAFTPYSIHKSKTDTPNNIQNGHTGHTGSTGPIGPRGLKGEIGPRGYKVQLELREK